MIRCSDINFVGQIPFSDFTLTNSGTISEEQPTMLREKVRTVGISVLMPNLTQNEPMHDEGLPFDISLERWAISIPRSRTWN